MNPLLSHVPMRRPAPVPRPMWGIACVVTVGAMAITAGCGKPQTRVRGVVTLDGSALKDAIVQFCPERREAGGTAATVTDAAGRFEVSVAPTAYRVAVMAERTLGQKKDDSNPNAMIDIREMVTPDRYRRAGTSPLTVEAVDGRTTVVELRLISGEE